MFFDLADSLSLARLGKLALLTFALLAYPAINCHAEAISVDYRCAPAQEALGTIPPKDGWNVANDNTVVLKPGGTTCWARIKALAGQVPATGQALSFFTNRVRVDLIDTQGNVLGSVDRYGQQVNAIETIKRALFTRAIPTGDVLYAKLTMDRYDGYQRSVPIELVDLTMILAQDQRHEDFQYASFAALLLIAFIAIMFAFALRSLNYALFSLYALSLAAGNAFYLLLPQHFLHSPWLAWIWFSAMYSLSNGLNLIVLMRLGRFSTHSLQIGRVLQFCVVGFFLLFPLWYFDAQPADHTNSLLNLISIPLIYIACWRGWRKGNSNCLILLISNIPSTLLWIPDFAYDLTGVGIPWTISSNNDWFSLASDLLLPLMFLGILAGRSLTLRQEKHYLKMHDVVTGLPNRESLQQIKINQHSIGFDLVVLAVNVKRFREINEALGIKIGDQLLAEVGRRLSSVGAEHIARLHTDQFCLLTTDSQLANVLEKLHQVFSYPAQVNGQIVDLALAIGAARERELSDTSSENLSVTNLLRNAEIALDVARTYRLDWVEYDKVLEVGRQGDLGLMSGISQAISNNEFRLYLQPKIRMADGGMVSAEALIRWEHPTRGLIAPEHFIPFAEKTGCIRMITKWVLSEAMDIVAMLRANGTPIQLGVNLSAFDLDDTALLKLLEQLLIEHRANPADIRFEITEHSAMNNPIAALEVMHGLCNLGFSISIDDFGTGYSSLAYLQKMPVSELKIDRSFVKKFSSEDTGFVLLKSIISLGHQLGLSIVAEGVENADEWDMLVDLDCDYVQGFYISEAMELDQFEAWWKNQSTSSHQSRNG